MADQVVTRGQCSGDGNSSLKSVEDSVTGPDTLVLGSGNETLFEDLDCSSFVSPWRPWRRCKHTPNFAGSVPAITCAGALCHIHQE
jgi:hypothetical protein